MRGVRIGSVAHGEQGCGRTVAERISTQSTLKVSLKVRDLSARRVRGIVIVATLRDAAPERAGTSGDDCSGRLAAATSVVGGASDMRLATACAMTILRSGG
eukprot:984477-Pleurochrysis_carterae.AAC.1